MAGVRRRTPETGRAGAGLFVPGDFPAAQLFETTPVFFGRQTTLPGPFRHPGFTPGSPPVQCLPQQADKTTDNLLPVTRLCPTGIRRYPQHPVFIDSWGKAAGNQLSLPLIKARGINHIKGEGDPGVDLVDILSPGAAAAGKRKRQLRKGYVERSCNFHDPIIPSLS